MSEIAMQLAAKVKELLNARIETAALDLLERDPHLYGTRPCATCQAISSIIGRDFGCVRRAKGNEDW